jgi:hypothetical protein
LNAVYFKGKSKLIVPTNILCLTLPSPKERVLKKSEVKVLSFGEDLGEAKLPVRS